MLLLVINEYRIINVFVFGVNNFVVSEFVIFIILVFMIVVFFCWILVNLDWYIRFW